MSVHEQYKHGPNRFTEIHSTAKYGCHWCRTPSEMQGKLTVAFHGEEGIDAGGVTREWYQVGACCHTFPFPPFPCTVLSQLVLSSAACLPGCTVVWWWENSHFLQIIAPRCLHHGAYGRAHRYSAVRVKAWLTRPMCVQVMAREIFNPNFSLFVPVPMGGSTFQPNPNSVVQNDEARGTNHLDFFKFVGRVVGKALHDGQYIDAYFTRSFYKHMLGQPLTYQVLCIIPRLTLRTCT